MSRNHQEIQEELTLWALGVAPDLPLTSLVEHLAACDECRRLVHETYEIAGQLAAGVELRRPPEGLKTKLLERVRARDPLLLEGADATTLFGNHASSTSPDSRHARLASASRKPASAAGRTLRSWIGGGLAAALALSLVLGNVSLNRYIERQEERLAAWAARYETDTRWLRSAEYLLVHEIGPALVADLVSPGGLPGADPSGGRGDPPAPGGKAAAYFAYDNRLYLIVSFHGLSPGEVYEVWASGDGAYRLIDTATADDQGNGSVTYPTDSSMTWEAIEVRGAGRRVLLRGELRPSEPMPRDW